MPFWLEIVVAFILPAIVASALIFYVLYRLSPERRWRSRLERRMADAENRLRAERRELKEVEVEFEKEERSIRRRAFDTFLNGLSVTELEAYPGIGPGTVSKLRSAGFANLAMLQDARIRVRGLGAKRLVDIGNAVRGFVKQARSRFEAGACHEAQNSNPQLEAVRAQHAQQECLLRGRLAGAEAVMAALRPLLKKARKVTFFRYLRRQSDPALPPELLDTPLPDLERTIQAAENRAAAEYASRSKSIAKQPSAPIANVPGAVPDGSEELFQEALRSSPPPTQPLFAAPVSPSETTEPRELRDLARLDLTVEFAFAVARADGRIARKEKEIIEQYIRARFGNDLALLNRATAFCAHYESAAIDLDRCLQQITRFFTADERQALFDFANEIADATGQRNQREVEFLEKVATKLGTQPEKGSGVVANLSTACNNDDRKRLSTSVPSPTPATPAERLTVLEIDPATPLCADLVRRQFNLLSERYAPDKFEAMGSEFVAVAENKRAALRAAATALLEQWGEKLETNSAPEKLPELRHNPDLDAILGA